MRKEKKIEKKKKAVQRAQHGSTAIVAVLSEIGSDARFCSASAENREQPVV